MNVCMNERSGGILNVNSELLTCKSLGHLINHIENILERAGSKSARLPYCSKGIRYFHKQLFVI